MTKLTPIYTAENCRFAYQLNWSFAAFWRQPPDGDDWLPKLKEATEPDGVRILKHRFTSPDVSLFLVSTKPDVKPSELVRVIKGRLQYLVRDQTPKAFRRNYSLRSIGSTCSEKLNEYVASQIEHHPPADTRVKESLSEYQIHNPQVDLTAQRRTAHAVFWYNLHVVLVSAGRWREIRADRLAAARDMIRKVSARKAHSLSRAAILPDHIHLTIGCQPDESPAEVGLSYLNNLAFAAGMSPVFQQGGFLGTFGEYDLGAVRD